MATWKEKYNKKYDYPKSESHSLSDISKDTGVSKKGLQQIYNKGIGAYKTNPQSVRPTVTSKEQWAMARVYSSVMGGKASKVDAKELKMQMGGSLANKQLITKVVLTDFDKKTYFGQYKKVFDVFNKEYSLGFVDGAYELDSSGQRDANGNYILLVSEGISGNVDERLSKIKGITYKEIYIDKNMLQMGGTIAEMIECYTCDWSWKESEGGEDKYVCHKCGTDNTENYMDKSINDLERSEFYKGYYERLSPSNFNVMQKGGKIQIDLPMATSHDGIDEVDAIANGMFKKGGETDFNPDGQIKDKIVHASGDAGGMLVGKRHSNGGIKALNKSTGQPLEMEGGEVVITRDAVSDNKKRSFNGKMMTNRQILSAINESGGGVSFADGGQVPNDVQFDCNAEYEYGGKTMCGKDLAYALGGVTTAIVTDPNEAMADLQSTYGFGDVYAKGGEVNEAYVDFMNKDKGFKVERKYFKTYEDAEKWARNEFEKFYPDMIGYTEYERPLTNYDKGGDVKLFEYPLTSDDKKFLYHNALISVEKDGKVLMIGIIMGVYTDMLKLKPLYVSEDYNGATIESSLSISEQILIDILNGNPQSVTVYSKMEYLTDINNIKGLTSFQIETARKILKAYFGNLSINFLEFFEKTLNPNAPDVEKVVIKKGGEATSTPFDSYNQLYKNYIQGLYVDSQYGKRIKIGVNNNTVESFEFRVGRKKVIKKWDNSYWRIGNGKKTPPYYDFLLSLFGVGLEGYSRTNYNYIRFIDPSKTSFTEREQKLKKAIDKLISEGYKVLPVIDLRNQNLKHNDIVNEETGDVDSIIIDEENKKILLEEWDVNKKQFYLYKKLGFIPKKITEQDVTIIAPLVNYSKQKNYLEGRIKALATELELKKVALKNEEIAFYLREIKLFTRRLRELNQVDIEQNDTIKKRLEMSFNKQWGDINQEYPPCKFPSINGKPSQLTKKEFITVRTENFKLFFGDWEEAYEDKNYINVSKVIDNVTKEPLAVFHGTNVLFTNWKTYESNNAHYFTVKRKMANFFATTWDSRGDKAGVDSQLIKKLNPNTGEFVYRCFLDIRNPIDFSRFGVDKRPIKDFLDFLKINYNIYDFDFFSNLNTNKEKVLETKVFAWQIIRMWQNFTTYIRLYTTYDGYIFYEYIPDSAKQGLDDASLSFCTFDSDQNKFANSNEFNSLSLDSRFENGGKI